MMAELAGQNIANIYTYALKAVKIGQSVQMVVEHDQQKVTLTVTPEARR